MFKMILLSALVSFGSNAFAARCDVDAPPSCHSTSPRPPNIPSGLLAGKIFESKNLPNVEVIAFTKALNSTTLNVNYIVNNVEETSGSFTASMSGYQTVTIEYRETAQSPATVVERFEIVQNYVYNKIALKGSKGSFFVQQ